MMRNTIIIISVLLIYRIAGDFLTDLRDDNELNYIESNETLSPTIENATAISPCSINVTWSCDECSTFNVLNYIVYWNETGMQEVENDVFNYVIDGLLATTLYEVYVSAIYDDAEYESDTTTETTFMGDPPGISALCIYEVTDTRMQLSWVTTNDECPIKEYIIKFNGNILCNEGKEDSGSETTTEQYIELYGLTPYTNYTVNISVVSTDGIRGEESSFSCILTDEAAPGSPESITTNVISASVIELSWEPPLECNGILTDYIVSWQLSSEESFTGNLTTLETSVQVTDLFGCGNYEFNVQATTSAGKGDSVTTNDNTLPEVPPPVTNFHSSGTTSESANLTWTSPDTLCPIINYILNGTGYVLWEENVDFLNATFGGNFETFELLSLIPWTDYNACIYAVTEEGIGNSSCTDLQTLEDEPSEPTNLTQEVLSSTDVKLSWNPPEYVYGNLSFYIISWETIYNNITQANEATTNDTKITVSELSPCLDYDFIVVGTTGAGGGDPASTDATLDFDLPPPPINSECDNVKSDSIEVNWIESQSTCPIVEYEITTEGMILWNNFSTSQTQTTADLNITLTKLVPYTKYSTTIRATSNVDTGYGSSTKPCYSTTLEDVPGPPTNLKVIEDSITASKFLVSWNAPIEKNGILLGFNITLNNGLALYVDYENQIENYTVAFDNLKAKTQYTVKVYAETGAGLGKPSETNTETKAAESDNGSNAGLILGITIPLLVIIGAFAGLGYYYRDRIIERINNSRT